MKHMTCALTAMLFAAGLASAAHGKTLAFCSEASPEGFDPAPFITATTMDASAQALYNRLIEYEPGTTKLMPGLAESWDVSEDGLEITFHLRRGVKFHTTGSFTPSRDFNADDVVFTFERQWKDGNPYFDYAGGRWEYFDGKSMPALLKEVKKVDDDTVTFVLNFSMAPMLANLAMDFASIVSKEYADQLEAAGTREKLGTEPVGTGPFQLVGYEPDAVIRYKANPDYWNGRPKIDDLIFVITPDSAVRWQKLKAGECQVMSQPNPADIEAMRADADINIRQQEGMDIGYLAYNTTQPPFDDAKVRKALNMAIDKRAIIEALFRGAGTVAKNPIPPTMWSYNGVLADDPYDTDAARQMLDAAGVNDLSMKIWAMGVPRAYNPNARRMAEMIQADFAKVGVAVEIVSYEWGEFLKRTADKDREGAVLFGWTGDDADPDSFLGVLLGCDAVGLSNRAQWCHQPFEDLIRKARTTFDLAERTKLYEEAQAIFKNEAPWATIAHSVTTVAMARSVRDFKVGPLGHFRFDAVDITE